MPAKKPTGVKISQNDIAKAVGEMVGLTKNQTLNVISEFQDEIINQLKAGNNVALSLGVFMRADKEDRKGRNPHTGESIDISASNGVKFKVGSTLKKALN